MPTSRAPSRSEAAARNTLPCMVAPKNQRSPSTSAAQHSSTASDWPDTFSTPRSKLASVSAGALASSGPKNTRPRPISTKCSAIAMISSASTEASATGRNAKRQISGPMGVTMASASRIEIAGIWRGASNSAAAVTTSG